MLAYRLHETSTMYRLWHGTYLIRLHKRASFRGLNSGTVCTILLQQRLQLSGRAGLEASFSHLFPGCWIDPANVDVEAVQRTHESNPTGWAWSHLAQLSFGLVEILGTGLLARTRLIAGSEGQWAGWRLRLS